MKKILPEINLGKLNKLYTNNYSRRFLEQQYLRHFFKDAPEGSGNKGRILFYAGISSAYNRHKEILMYHLLKKEGYEVDYFICDGVLPACEILTKQIVETQGKEPFCKKCVKNGLNSLNASKVKYHFISNEFFQNEIKNLDNLTLNEVLKYKYDDIDFGNIVEGVLFRYYKSIKFGDDAEQVGKKYLKASLINYLQVKEQTKKHNYNYLFFSHGIYSTWQPVVEFCHRNKIKFVCYDRAKKLGSANFNINIPSPVWDFSEAWKNFAGRDLNSNELAMVDSYLKEREFQKNDVYAYNFSGKEADLHKLKRELNIKPQAKIITFYTNLIWDAANVSRDIAFKSPLECIEKTISRFRNAEDVHIIIRTHPAEKVLGTKERYGNLIREKIKDLPSNVSIIEPEMNINSFSIIDLSDIGVVHTSTVGLEMAIENKPVILISETHYRGKGFTYDAQSEEDYFEKLNKLVQQVSPTKDQVNLSKKYFYLMMFEYQKQMPLTFKDGIFDGYSYNQFNDIPGTEEIRKIISSIEKSNIQDFVFWDRK